MGEKDKKLKFTATDIRTFFYCPRLYFFQEHLKEKPVSPRQRVRLLLGRLYHVYKRLKGRLKGWKTEEQGYIELGSISIHGRADAVERGGETLLVHEYKSGKAPRRGVWLSDLMQAVAYAFIFSRKTATRELLVQIHYRDKSIRSSVDTDTIAIFMRALEDMYIIKKHGVLPDPNPSPGKCSRCPFSGICKMMEVDGALSGWVREMGPIYPVSSQRN